MYRDARVHERTVQAVARGDVPSPPGPRPARAPRRRPQPVSKTQAHPLAMAVARRALAAGSYTRIEVVSATEVWVR